MNQSLPDFAQAKILVVGDVMLDRYWHGPASRISPEAPVPVVRVDEIEERPGGAGNVGLNISTLGGKATVVGLTGDDEAADSLTHKLQGSHITCDFERMPRVPTITKLRVISRHQQLIRMDFEKPVEPQHAQALVTRTSKHFDDIDVIVCSDYGKGALANVQDIIQQARAAGIPVLVDPRAMTLRVIVTLHW